MIIAGFSNTIVKGKDLVAALKRKVDECKENRHLELVHIGLYIITFMVKVTCALYDYPNYRALFTRFSN